MAELITLARPYAKAAFEFARQAKDLAGWEQALQTAAAISGYPGVESLFDSPNYTSEDKADTFVEICGDAINQRQSNFIQVLAEHKRLALLPQVLELFVLYKANHEKTVDVEIYSAFAISSELEQKLVDSLKAKLDRKIELRTEVDSTLIGGALIRAGDMVIDGSARGRLAKLSEAMNM